MEQTLIERLRAERTVHFKASNKIEVGILRCLIGDLETDSTRHGIHNIEDKAVLAKVKSFLKLNLVAIEALRDVHDRTGETTPEQSQQAFDLGVEQAVLRDFMPKQLTDDMLVTIIDDWCDSNDGINMGDVMKMLSENYNGRYNGKTASTLARQFV